MRTLVLKRALILILLLLASIEPLDAAKSSESAPTYCEKINVQCAELQPEEKKQTTKDKLNQIKSDISARWKKCDATALRIDGTLGQIDTLKSNAASALRNQFQGELPAEAQKFYDGSEIQDSTSSQVETLAKQCKADATSQRAEVASDKKAFEKALNQSPVKECKEVADVRKCLATYVGHCDLAMSVREGKADLAQAHASDLMTSGEALKAAGDQRNTGGGGSIQDTAALMGAMGQMGAGAAGLAGQGGGSGGDKGQQPGLPELPTEDEGENPYEFDLAAFCQQQGAELVSGQCKKPDQSKENCEKTPGFKWDGAQCIADQSDICASMGLVSTGTPGVCDNPKFDNGICGAGEKMTSHGCVADSPTSGGGGGGGGGSGGNSGGGSRGPTTVSFPTEGPGEAALIEDTDSEKPVGSTTDLGIAFRSSPSGGLGGGDGSSHKSLGERFGNEASPDGTAKEQSSAGFHPADSGSEGGAYGSGSRSSDFTSSGDNTGNLDSEKRDVADDASETNGQAGGEPSGVAASLSAVSTRYMSIVSAGPKEPSGLIMESMRVTTSVKNL